MSTRVERKPSTTKRMILMIVGVLVLIAIIAGIKVLLVMRMIAGMPKPAPATVTTTAAEYQSWQPTIDAVGTLRAARGADLALDVSGLVESVKLESGDDVKKGQVLLKLRDEDDQAKLAALQATAKLAGLTADRSRKQLAVQAISRAQYDTDMANLKSAQAQVDAQAALVAKKTLRAPFAGRAGIITVSPGAYLNAGNVIVTVQQLDPLYVDFFVPQSELSRVRQGQHVTMTLDAFKGRNFSGALTAINPKVDPDTRNVQVEATIPNHDHLLSPGMFAKVSIDAGSKHRYLTLPQTAVVYNPYGDTVYIVSPSKGKDDKGQPLPPTVQQAFVTTGPTRGDQVAVLKGIEPGTVVVTSGQMKLKSGASVRVDNSVQPANNPNPTPQEH